MTSLLLFFEGIGTSEMVLILVVILMFFGANKIPELARGLGKGIRQFKDASSEIRSEFERAGQPGQPNYQNYPPAPQPDPYQQPAYQPYQPHPEGYQAPPVAPVDYNAPYSAPPVADYHQPISPPAAVTSPPAEPAPYPHDTPLPPNQGVTGVPGTRPRLDQSHSDA